MVKVRKVPLRNCVGCQGRFEKKELLRIVKPKDEDITVDTKGKKSGRGCYICKKKECLDLAIKGKKIEHALEAPLPEGFYEAVLEVIEHA